MTAGFSWAVAFTAARPSVFCYFSQGSGMVDAVSPRFARGRTGGPSLHGFEELADFFGCIQREIFLLRNPVCGAGLYF
jgi:hypothetical protein